MKSISDDCVLYSADLGMVWNYAARTVVLSTVVLLIFNLYGTRATAAAERRLDKGQYSGMRGCRGN